MSNTIIRATRRDRYVTIEQHVIEDARLSWAARGLLAYLLSKPDDWKVLVKTIPTDTKESGSNSGENNCPEIICWVPEDLHVKARDIVAHLDPTAAQIVIDEWAGNLAAGRIEKSPLGFLRVLVKRFESGQFRVQCAEVVAEVREQEEANSSQFRDSGE
ncbi:MAG: hypothetical protein ACN4GR_14220 [Arenicellales bacterium]